MSPEDAPPNSNTSRDGTAFQLDTVFVNLTLTKAIKHFTAYDPQNGPTAKPSTAPPLRAPQPSSTKSSPTCHSP